MGMRRGGDEVPLPSGGAVFAQRQLHVLAAHRIGALTEEREGGVARDVRLLRRGRHCIVLASREVSMKLAVIVE